MAKAMLLALIAIAVSLGLSPAGRVQAADAPNILIVGEDQHRDTLPRHSWVMQQALQQLNNHLSDAGFAVFDETSITLETHTQGRSRRAEAEIIDVARAVKVPPVDIAVLYSIFATTVDQNYTKKITMRVTARLIDVKTGQHIGSFEVAPDRVARVPTDCDRNCLLTRIDRSAKSLTRDLGTLLARRVQSSAVILDDNGAAGQASIGWPSAYTLVFEGFSTAEILEIEEYFVVFTGYRHHRPTQTALKRHEYWYESGSPRGRLIRNFSKMLHHLQLPGYVSFADNKLTVTKTATTAQAAGRWDDW